MTVILSQYTTRKTVNAAKIQRISEPNDINSGDGRALIYFADKDYILVSKEYMDKHKPHVGGYYIRYKDGYPSFCPGETFEESATFEHDGSLRGILTSQAMKIGIDAGKIIKKNHILTFLSVFFAFTTGVLTAISFL